MFCMNFRFYKKYVMMLEQTLQELLPNSKEQL